MCCEEASDRQGMSAAAAGLFAAQGCSYSLAGMAGLKNRNDKTQRLSG
ncbi:hypothetical protein PSN_2295 [Pseudomonas sp. NGC7]